MSREMPDVQGVEHRFVTANGLRMHVAEAGDPDAEPVVCLHGWPQHWYEWRHLIPPLAEHHRVICPDLRGLGWTDAPARGYEKESMATDVLALLDELRLERVNLVGHDWGGWIGFLIGMREPERVRRFLALNIVPPFVRINPRAVLAGWRLWYQLPIASPLGARMMRELGGLGRTVTRWVGGDTWSQEESEVFLGQFREPDRARASVQYYRTFQLRELPALVTGRHRSARLRVPTHILFGTRERVMVREWFDGVERRADDLTVEFVADAGHFIADEKPDLVRDRALELFG